MGLTDLKIKINSIGDAECRPAYLEKLTAYFAEHEDQLCKDHAARYKINPLRVLDCKRDSCLSASDQAPRSIDFLCDACQEHWDGLRSILDDLIAANALTPWVEASRRILRRPSIGSA